MASTNFEHAMSTSTQIDHLFNETLDNVQPNTDRFNSPQDRSNYTDKTDAAEDLPDHQANVEPTTFWQYDLTNEIHPVFAQGNFIDEIDYAAITPALRLASRFIMTDCLMDYWYAVLCTKPVKETDEGGGDKSKSLPEDAKDQQSQAKTSQKEECADRRPQDPDEDVPDGLDADSFRKFSMYRKPDSLTQDDLLEVKSCLEGLASNVIFALGTCRRDNADTLLLKERLEDVYVNSHYRSDWKRWRTVTRIDEKAYRSLVQTYYESSEATGLLSGSLVQGYFNLAVTLVHELAHIAHLTRFANGSVHFEDYDVSENGFDWESLVFGGLIHKDFGDFGGLLPWPCFEVDGRGDTNSGLSVKTRTETKGFTWWGIPHEYYPPLLQTAFWENIVEACGADALKISKEDAGSWFDTTTAGARLRSREINDDLFETTLEARAALL